MPSAAEIISNINKNIVSINRDNAKTLISVISTDPKDEIRKILSENPECFENNQDPEANKIEKETVLTDKEIHEVKQHVGKIIVNHLFFKSDTLESFLPLVMANSKTKFLSELDGIIDATTEVIGDQNAKDLKSAIKADKTADDENIVFTEVSVNELRYKAKEKIPSILKKKIQSVNYTHLNILKNLINAPDDEAFRKILKANNELFGALTDALEGQTDSNVVIHEIDIPSLKTTATIHAISLVIKNGGLSIDELRSFANNKNSDEFRNYIQNNQFGDLNLKLEGLNNIQIMVFENLASIAAEKVILQKIQAMSDDKFELLENLLEKENSNVQQFLDQEKENFELNKITITDNQAKKIKQTVATRIGVLAINSLETEDSEVVRSFVTAGESGHPESANKAVGDIIKGLINTLGSQNIKSFEKFKPLKTALTKDQSILTDEFIAAIKNAGINKLNELERAKKNKENPVSEKNKRKSKLPMWMLEQNKKRYAKESDEFKAENDFDTASTTYYKKGTLTKGEFKEILKNVDQKIDENTIQESKDKNMLTAKFPAGETITRQQIDEGTIKVTLTNCKKGESNELKFKKLAQLCHQEFLLKGLDPKNGITLKNITPPGAEAECKKAFAEFFTEEKIVLAEKEASKVEAEFEQEEEPLKKFGH